MLSRSVAAAPTWIRSARWACVANASSRAAAASIPRPAVRVACLPVRLADRVVADAEPVARRAEAFVAEALRFVALRT